MGKRHTEEKKKQNKQAPPILKKKTKTQNNKTHTKKTSLNKRERDLNSERYADGRGQ